jgi:hypothetical protein
MSVCTQTIGKANANGHKLNGFRARHQLPRFKRMLTLIFSLLDSRHGELACRKFSHWFLNIFCLVLPFVNHALVQGRNVPLILKPVIVQVVEWRGVSSCANDVDLLCSEGDWLNRVTLRAEEIVSAVPVRDTDLDGMLSLHTRDIDVHFEATRVLERVLW